MHLLLLLVGPPLYSLLCLRNLARWQLPPKDLQPVWEIHYHLKASLELIGEDLLVVFRLQWVYLLQVRLLLVVPLLLWGFPLQF